MATISVADTTVYTNDSSKPTDGAKLLIDLQAIVAESNSQNIRLTDIESNALSIGGVKTFTSIPVLPGTDPTSANQATRKAYVDAFTQHPVGAMIMYVSETTAPTGWLFMDGKTIGSASSSATSRANADTATLYSLLWNSTTNTELIIQDSAGSPTTRGASAAADFAANKRMPLPDARGRVLVGIDDLGGSAANRVTSSSTNGGNAINNFGAGGAQTHTLVSGEMPAHTHTYNTGVSGGANGTEASRHLSNANVSITGTTESTGGGTAHSNTQPWIATAFIIRYL